MSNDEDSNLETAARIDALLAFVPALEARFAGHWEGGDRRQDGTITAPWFDYSPEVLNFIRACGKNGWLRVYNWPEWQPSAIRLYEDPRLLAGADLDTLRKLLTLHIRKDRFSEGHLAAMVEAGHISAILDRLAEIRRTMA